MFKVLALALLTTLMALPAQAYYVELSLGQAEYDPRQLGSSIATRFMMGTELDPKLWGQDAIAMMPEWGYLTLGSADSSHPEEKYRYRVDGLLIGLQIQGTLWRELHLFGRLGLSFYEAMLDAQWQEDRYFSSGHDMYYGIGIGYPIFEKFGILLEFQQYRVHRIQPKAFFIGAVYRY